MGTRDALLSKLGGRVGPVSGTREWEKLHDTVVTASSLASVMGVSPWESREELLDRLAEGEPSGAPSAAMWWGIHGEFPLLVMASRMTQQRIAPISTLLLHNHLNFGVTLDGVSIPTNADVDVVSAGTRRYASAAGRFTGVGVDSLAGVNWPQYGFEDQPDIDGPVDIIKDLCRNEYVAWELKNSSVFMRKYYKGDSLPEHYEVQVQAQLWVTGLHYGVLCAKLGSSNLVMRLVEADQEMHRTFESELRFFARDLEDTRKGTIL